MTEEPLEDNLEKEEQPEQAGDVKSTQSGDEYPSLYLPSLIFSFLPVLF